MSHTTSPPRIRIYDSASRHGRLSLPRRAPPAQHCSTSSAVPMPIPHARGESPPPPLPPPRHIIGLDAAPELSSSSWHVGSPRHDPGAASLSGPVSTAAAALRSGLSLLNGNGNGAGAGAGPTRASNTGSGDDTDSLDIRSSRRHSSSATTHTIDTDLNYEVDMSDDERPGPKRPTGANRRCVSPPHPHLHLHLHLHSTSFFTLGSMQVSPSQHDTAVASRPLSRRLVLRTADHFDSCRLHSECQLGQRTLDHHSNAYDKQLLAKIGGPKPLGLGPRPPPRAGSGSSTSGGTFLSPTPQDTIPAGARSPRDRLGELKPLSMPDKRHGSMDAGNSSARWTSAPSSGVSSGLSSGVSPGNSSMFRSPFEPASSAASEYSWRRHNSASTPDASTVDDSARSKRGSEDHGVFMDHDFAMDNENGMRELHLGERGGIMTGGDDYQLGSGAPLKRRAPSPPGEPTREDRSSVGNDVYHRRSAQMLNSRSSPVSRYQSVHGSVSSASSAGPKTNSLASSNMSNMSWNHSMASSMTSYGERLSPSALSPAVDVGAEYGAGPVSPYAASRSLNPSPRSSVSRPPHHRASTTTFPDHDSPQSRSVPADAAKMQGHYICECCPKKPKKFESAQELRYVFVARHSVNSSPHHTTQHLHPHRHRHLTSG